MDTESLRHFFAAYFHEDWTEEAESADEVVVKFAAVLEANRLRALSASICEFTQQFTDDEELGQRLFRDLGCYYLPASDGMACRSWLLHVADLPLKHSGK
jgi:hypothetical protein